jgi:hypothetical protein
VYPYPHAGARTLPASATLSHVLRWGGVSPGIPYGDKSAISTARVSARASF